MKHAQVLSFCLFFLIAALLGACNDDVQINGAAATDPMSYVKNGELQQGAIDFAYGTDAVPCIKDATYTLHSIGLFMKDDLTNGRWEKSEPGDGWTCPVKQIIVVRGAYCWEHIDDCSPATGPTRFAVALAALNNRLGKNYIPYIRKNISFDPDETTVSIRGRKYGLLLASDSNMTIAHESNYYGGRTHNGGISLTIATYTASAPLEFDDTTLAFDSETDAYNWLIDFFRTTFGESADLNKCFDGIILDHPMLRLDDIVRERDCFFSLFLQ